MLEVNTHRKPDGSVPAMNEHRLEFGANPPNSVFTTLGQLLYHIGAISSQNQVIAGSSFDLDE